MGSYLVKVGDWSIDDQTWTWWNQGLNINQELPVSEVELGIDSGQLNVAVHEYDATIINSGLNAPRLVIEYELLDYEKKEYGFFEAIPAGISLGYSTLTSYVKSLGLLFSKEGAKQLGGFGTIGGIFPDTWDWKRFWGLTAFLSIILAFMNILPIPALDGGHVMFLIYEMISGKAPGEKFLTRAQVVGMVLLLGLLLYANGMDVYRWITGS